jgi:hypothetical protein
VPPAYLVTTVLFALALQWVIARVYVDLIVNLVGGTSVGHGGGVEIPISYAVTAIASAACAVYCERRIGPSRMIVVIHLLAVIIPLQALVAAQYELARPAFATVVALVFVGALAVAGLMPEVRLPVATKRARQVFLGIACLLTAYVYGALLARGGLGRLSFDLMTVYEVREDFLADIAPLMGYLVPWQAYVLNPAIMLMGFKRRSLLLGGFGLGLQLLLFGMTGFRAFLLIPLLLIGVLLIARRRHLAAFALAGVMTLIAIALLLYARLDQPIFATLLVDRVFVIPAELHYWYYDYFGVQGQAPLQLSQSMLSALTEAHYRAPIAEVIGWKYMGTAGSANVGLFADAFANFGFSGCAVFGLLFALLLKSVDAASRGTDRRVATALIGMPAFQLVNSGLLTTLLTHGFALAIILLWFLPRSASPDDGSAEDRD